MAIQRVCDRCGAVINPPDSGDRIVFDKGPSYLRSEMDHYDLCVSCTFHLKAWLNREETWIAND